MCPLPHDILNRITRDTGNLKYKIFRLFINTPESDLLNIVLMYDRKHTSTQNLCGMNILERAYPS